MSLLAPARVPGIPAVPGHLPAIIGGLPLLPTPPVSPPRHTTCLTLWLFSGRGGIGVAGTSSLGKLMCPQRRRKRLALLQNVWSPMTHVSSLSVEAGLLGNRLSPEREVGRRPYSPFVPLFPPGNLKLPTENCIQGLLFLA